MASEVPQCHIDTPLDTVAGHAGTLFHGPRTDHGVETMWKYCSAWEVMWYLAMHFAPLLPPHSAQSGHVWSAGCERFVRAVAPLRAFTAALTRVRPPSQFTLAPPRDGMAVPMPPSTMVTSASYARHATVAGPCDAQDGEAVWMDVHDMTGVPLLALLLEALFARAQAVPGHCGDVYDKPVWAVGLVNLTSHMALPCVMDIKIGYVRDSPFTDPAKRARIAAKQAHSLTRQLALRFCGAHYYAVGLVVPPSTTPSPSSVNSAARCGGWHKVRVDKSDGYALTTVGQFDQRVRNFFSATCLENTDGAEKGRLRMAAVRAELQALLHYFSATDEGEYVLQTMALVSSSLLFVYDAQASGGTAHVHLIDFGRSSARHLNYDEVHIGFVDGLRSMIACLARGEQ